MNFNVMGRYPNGRTGYIDLDPIDIKLGRYLHAQGSVELPSGMTGSRRSSGNCSSSPRWPQWPSPFWSVWSCGIGWADGRR